MLSYVLIGIEVLTFLYVAVCFFKRCGNPKGIDFRWFHMLKISSCCALLLSSARFLFFLIIACLFCWCDVSSLWFDAVKFSTRIGWTQGALIVDDFLRSDSLWESEGIWFLVNSFAVNLILLCFNSFTWSFFVFLDYCLPFSLIWYVFYQKWMNPENRDSSCFPTFWLALRFSLFICSCLFFKRCGNPKGIDFRLIHML